MKKIISIFLTTAFLFQSCENKTDKKLDEFVLKKDSISIKNTELVFHPSKEDVKYSLIVEKIDSIQYHSEKEKVKFRKDEIKKITDFQTAKKMLKNIVFFNENDQNEEAQAVLKIRFRNGKENVYTNDFDYFYFVAYYPTEDILLTEGAHTTDISFNLKNGNETKITGNPGYIKTSPSKLFRLNGHYNGQECSSYFIQKKSENEYEKIIQLDEEFEKQTKVWLCIMGDSFWGSDTILFFTTADGYGKDWPNLGFYKIEIIEK
ncbi:hypothetical protein [Allomuricauda sp. NBRC 101325]|uniref:hypothetical protein n=1 Tax=Allomuricauda sp. NBRC 101325 TaxID=1113758 RepID=UPI0024A3BBF2|nr:hypothetical protein [Muricauda sp. NBRC 101325]GLU44395.1 hypothetical protein Musp01_20190 [Muricauda sp. NBRC 101325]